MASASLRTVFRHLRPATAGGLSDAELLERFVNQHDEGAFELLVWRHERMVLGVCRRVLGSRHDAEDAFQATFLVLVRKAASIGRRAALASWLYQVAYRISLRAHATAGKRARHEQRRPDLSFAEAPCDPASAVVWQELWPLLDQEVSSLPEKYRAPVVLCYLEGKTYEEAARQLGCPKGTVSTRLTRARELLRTQLTRKGLALSSVLLGTALCAHAARAAAPAVLVDATIKAALWYAAARGGTVGLISAKVVALAEGVLKTMSLTQLRVAAALLMASVIGLSAGTYAYQTLAAEPREANRGSTPRPLGLREEVGALACLEGHTDGITRVTFSPDGRRLLSSSLDHTVRLWDVETGKQLQVLEGHTERADCVAFARDGRQALSCGWDGTIRLWDLDTCKELKCLVSQGAPGLHVTNVAFFPDGKRILVNAVDHHALQIMDLDSGKVVKEFAEHPDHVGALALSPDGRRVLEGNWDGHLRLWDIDSGKLLRDFADHPGHVYGVAFAPDGRQALSGSLSDNTPHLWNLESGKEIRRFEGHAKHVDFVAYAPDGRRALSCGPDQTVRLWHVATGAELRRYFGHTERVECVAFSPDGRYAVSGGADKTVRLWRLPR